MKNWSRIPLRFKSSFYSSLPIKKVFFYSGIVAVPEMSQCRNFLFLSVHKISGFSTGRPKFSLCNGTLQYLLNVVMFSEAAFFKLWINFLFLHTYFERTSKNVKVFLRTKTHFLKILPTKYLLYDSCLLPNTRHTNYKLSIRTTL